jgi:nucleoside-diphosphate-sugar epimerase
VATGSRTLVTGGAGYVGSIVVEELLARGQAVRVLDSLAHGSVPSLLHVWGDEDFEFVRGDVRDPDARARALVDVDSVVHLAAIVGDPACSREPELAREVNVDATRALLSESEPAGVRRFVFASTCSNYGKLADPEAYASEEWELSPVSLYAETKVEAELDVLARARNGLPGCCLRFATVYGASPRMRFDLTVNEFVRDLAEGRELVVFGEQFWRPYVHVRDAASAVVLALTAPEDRLTKPVFNVGQTSENYRKLDLVELLKERFEDAAVSFVHKDEDPRDYRVSFEKIKADLGFEPAWSVPRGMDEVHALVRSGLLADPYADVYRN